jgi:dimethylargininase
MSSSQSTDPIAAPVKAMIRQVPRSYPARYGTRGIAIDRAERQHADYVRALEVSGLRVVTIPADESFADCVFIEDTAVVWGSRALRASMAPHREGEQGAVIAQLGTDHEIVTLPVGARLDGGDVLHAGEVTYVGLSSRTNVVGAESVRRFLAPAGRDVISVPVDRSLHLKSAATWLGDGTMLVAPELIDPRRFEAHRTLTTSPGEDRAANTLRIGSQLLALRGYQRTFETLNAFAHEHDIVLRLLDMSEFEKGDGSLTCLSIVM